MEKGMCAPHDAKVTVAVLRLESPLKTSDGTCPELLEDQGPLTGIQRRRPSCPIPVGPNTALMGASRKVVREVKRSSI